MNNKISSKVYFWNFVGNIVAAGVSTFFLLIVSRFTSAETADTFSIVYAICNLWVVIGLFQVRNYQATDINHLYSITEYFIARCSTSILMLLTIYPYIYFAGYNVSNVDFVVLIFLIILYRTGDVFSDLFQGLFQQNEALDVAGKLMTVRYTSVTLLLLVSLILTKSLYVSFILVVAINFIFVLFGDYQKSKQFENIELKKISRNTLKNCLNLLKTCFPLFFNGFLLVYILNYPKQIIDRFLTIGLLSEGAQRDFSILFMPVFFMSLFVLALRPLVTDLAKLWAEHKISEFNNLVRKIILILLVLGILVSTVVYVIGIPILNFLTGLQLNSYSLDLTILVFSGFLYSIGSIIGDFLIILRKQVYLIIVYIATFILTHLITTPIMERYRLLGASISFFIVMCLYVLGSWLLFILMRRRWGRKRNG